MGSGRSVWGSMWAEGLHALVDGWGLLHAWAKGVVRGVPCLGSRGRGEGFMAVS